LLDIGVNLPIIISSTYILKFIANSLFEHAFYISSPYGGETHRVIINSNLVQNHTHHTLINYPLAWLIISPG